MCVRQMEANRTLGEREGDGWRAWSREQAILEGTYAMKIRSDLRFLPPPII